MPWPEVVEDGFAISLLDHAMQEGVAQYLKTGEMAPLLEFIKTAAEKFLKNCEDNTIPFSRSEKNASPDRWKRESLFHNLCEVYGFCGDFDSAWKTCVKTGLDHQHNYLIFGTGCRKRKFDTRQAYYFPLYRPPLTDAGRKQKAEIFPLVDDELKKFERQEKCNLFDYYLNLAEVATIRCFDVPDLDHFSSPTGQDVFERSEFQSSILREFQNRFTLGLQPFENRLKALFDDPNKYEKAKESTLQGFKTRLGRPLRHKHSFLYGHFWKVTFNPEKFGLRKNAHSLEAIYQGGHHVMLPYFPDLIQNCMVMHIANIFRSSENRFRQSLGLNGVGDGWVSESTLIALLKKTFPDEIIIHHATPEWLDRQHLDIFFPRAKLTRVIRRAGLQVLAVWAVRTETENASKGEGNYVRATYLVVLKDRQTHAPKPKFQVRSEVLREVERLLGDMDSINQIGELNFKFGDLLLSAPTAVLKVLTGYEEIRGLNPLERDAFEAEMLLEAEKFRDERLYPDGFDGSTWEKLQRGERFYLMGLLQESKGDISQELYQLSSKAYGITDYDDLLASKKANEARLMSPIEMRGRTALFRVLGEGSLTGALLGAVWEAERKDSIQDAHRHLRDELGTLTPETAATLRTICRFLAKLKTLPHWERSIHWFEEIDPGIGRL